MSEDEDIKDLLKEKVEEADLALTIKRVDDNPRQWAFASLEFANALSELANHETGETALSNYQDALHAYQNTLNVLNSNALNGDDYFSQRIRTTFQYVRTLRNYGLRQGGNGGLIHLHHGLRLTDELIRELTEPSFSFDHAMFNVEKGQFYRVLASNDRQENRKNHLENAAKALWEALDILRTKEKFNEWAMALIGLGLCLNDLSRLQNNDEAQKSLLMAIDAFKSASAFFQPDTSPTDHAFAQIEMGRCLLTLARRQTKDEAIKNCTLAIDTFKTALTVDPEKIEHELLMRTRADLAQALSFIASLDPENAKTPLIEAIALHRENIAQLEKTNDQITIAMAQGFLGRDLANLALSCQGQERFQLREEAIIALRISASDEFKRMRSKDWNVNLIELATTLHSLANELEAEDALQTFEEVITLYEKARLSITKESDPVLWARIQQWQALAFAHTGEADTTPRGLQRMKLAELGFRQALTVFTLSEKPHDYRQLQKNLSHLLYVISQRPDCKNPLSFLNSAALIMETIADIDNKKEDHDVDIAALFHLAVILWKRAIIKDIIKDKGFEEDYNKANELFTFINRQHDHADFNALEIQSNYAEFLLIWGENDLSKAGLNHLKDALNLWKNIAETAQKDDLETLQQIAYENMDVIKNAIKTHRQKQPFYKRLFWR